MQRSGKVLVKIWAIYFWILMQWASLHVPTMVIFVKKKLLVQKTYNKTSALEKKKWKCLPSASKKFWGRFQEPLSSFWSHLVLASASKGPLSGGVALSSFLVHDWTYAECLQQAGTYWTPQQQHCYIHYQNSLLNHFLLLNRQQQLTDTLGTLDSFNRKPLALLI